MATTDTNPDALLRNKYRKDVETGARIWSQVTKCSRLNTICEH